MNASEARSEPQASGGGGAGYAGAVPARRARGTAPTWLVCSLLALIVLAVYAQTLGVVLATQGRLEEARAQYLEALRLDPSSQIARSNLDRIRAESRSPP